MISRRRTWHFAILSVALFILALAGAEALLRSGVISRLRRKANLEAPPPLFVTDNRIGVRPNPEFPGHDKRGWRNPRALDQADIVALGDSQTYGIGAEREESWPARLAEYANQPVYQIAFGGYGPAHYLELLPEVLALKPKIVLAAFYFGNDILDSYWLTYNMQPKDFPVRTGDSPLDPFRLTDESRLAELRRVNEIDPMLLRSRYLDCQEPVEIPHIAVQSVLDISKAPPLEPFVKSTKSWWRELRLAKLFESAWLRFQNPKSVPVYPPPYCIEAVGKSVELSTMLMPGYRLLTLTDTDPRVVEGKRLSLLQLNELARAVPKNVRVVVVLIPTKELVFEQVPTKSDQDLRLLTQLRREERQYRDHVIRELSKSGIEFVDTLPALQAALSEGINPYAGMGGSLRDRADGHPRAAGYDRIAQAIASRLKR